MKGLIRHNLLIVATLIKDECCQKNKALTSLPHFHHHGFRVLVPHRNVLAWNYTGQFCDNSSSSRAIRSDSQQCHTITDINNRTKPNQDTVAGRAVQERTNLSKRSLCLKTRE
ncbi:unnamed protein product [Prunus armeniaca]